MTEYLVGTGGWAYFKVPNKPSLKAYSENFNFVEVNYTFYKYPSAKMVERWRQTVPKDFTFTVRCHQDLTHRIGFIPVDQAYAVFGRMIGICRILDAPFHSAQATYGPNPPTLSFISHSYQHGVPPCEV